jgi:peptidoglycan hydrolase-like protein with peptidoglycan-binding domain
LSYFKAVTGWRRFAAAPALLFAIAVTASPAAASPTTTGGGTALAPSATTTTPVATTTTSASSTTPASSTKQKASKFSSSLFGTRLLSLGMRGSDVVALQHDLTALGFTTAASGVFNQQTLQKLKAFQRTYKLSVDGVAGPTSISKLKRLLNSKLHITETALAAKELATGDATVATTPTVTPLPADDSGLTGGTSFTPPPADSPELDATLIDGLAVPAAGTPQVVVDIIDAANKIAFDPYIYGGGHKSFNSAGYDCSGSVSYALHGGGLLASPIDSSQFMSYGLPGKGNWLTIYTNGPTHAYIEIAGLWFDTAAQSASNGMDRWSTTRIAEPGYGKFVPRHPAGW